jgi:hypothetical protein
MATVLEQNTRGPSQRYDGVVESKLAKAESRIRSLDTMTGVLGFGVLTLSYALVMALLDRWLVLGLGVRQFAFLLYICGALGILAALTLRPLMRRVNPFYAAREIEKHIPAAKNSVVNWVDLHDRDLPASIKGAVGQRAAQDLGKVDLEQAFQGRQTVWLGVSTLVLGLALALMLLLIGFPQFRDLLKRAFIPFEGGVFTTRTHLNVKTGNTTVPVEQPATIVVDVEGRNPAPGQADSLQLLLRYRDSDPYEEPIFLDETEPGGREWQAVVPASRVRNGFWYKVKGGDAESAEYRVNVRSSALIKGFEARLHFPKYTGWVDQHTLDPNLRGLVGTEVTLIVHTNRPIQKGSLELTFDDKERHSLSAVLLKDDAQAMVLRFPLAKNGRYGVRFTTTDSEPFTDSMQYKVEVLQDRAPEVVLTKPGQDVTVAANGIVPLEGSANDDIGVTKMTLHMHVVDGPALRSKPYRAGKDFKLSDGSYPKVLEYREIIDLADLNDEHGAKAIVAEGKSIEYWLEAEDNFEPQHHVGESNHYKITLAPPNKDNQQQKQDREQAKKDQEQNDQKQDEKLKQEGDKRQEEAKGGQGDRDKPENNQGGGTENKTDPKKQGGDGEQSPKPDDGNKQKENGGGSSPQQQQDNKDIKNTENKLNNAGNNQQGGNDGQNQGKDDKAKAKDDPSKESKGGAKDQGAQDKPANKGGAKPDSGKGDQNKDKGQEKDGGNPGAGGAQDKAEAKADSKPQSNEAKGSPKDDKGENGSKGGNADKASAKNEGKPESNPAPGAEKDAGQGDQREQAAVKHEGAKPDAANPPASAKDAAGKKADGKPEAVAKGEPAQTEKSQDKGPGANNAGTPEEKKADAKEDKSQGSGPGKSDSKPAKDAAKNDAGIAKSDKPGEKATPEDVAKAAKDAQSGDEAKQKDASDKLDQMQRNAEDSKTRQAAKDALDELAKEQKKKVVPIATAKNAPEKSKDPSDKDNGAPGKPKEGPGKNNPEASSSKGDPSQKTPAEKGTSKDASGGSNETNPSDPNKRPFDPKNPADAQVKDQGQPDKTSQARVPGTGDLDHHAQESNTSDAQQGGAGDPENLKKAAELQLENIRDLVKKRPDILDKVGMKPEDLNRYYEAKQRQIDEYARQAREKAETTKTVANPPTKSPDSFTNIGAKPLQDNDAKTGTANKPGAGAPPPEFRDMYYKKFTRPKGSP